MLQKTLIPLSLIRDLRCRQCEKFVSCGPVYVVPDTSILCGRCRHLAKDIYRNYSYEALASMFMYPCHNWEDRCSRTLYWNESLQHEEECSYTGFFRFCWHHPRAYCKGKREIPEGDIRLTPVPEHLLEQIKCVQCECYLTCDPVYIQSNGKNVCHRCVHANGIPPNCLRNIAYERLSTIIIFPCIYRNRGCPTRLKFGRSLWQHEAECSYGQTFKKITKTPHQKERGVIKTHSGHYYGTLTPNGVLFAPPTERSEFDVNKEVLKSLKKQKERRFVRADEIGTQFEKMNSEDGSVYTDDSERKNSFNKSSSSGRSSPRLDDELKHRQPNPPYPPPMVEPGYFSNNITKSPQLNEYQNYLPQVHQSDYPSLSRNNSYNRAYSPSGIYANLGRDNTGSISPKLSNNLLAAHYPIFVYPQNLPPTPPYNGLQQGTQFNGGLQTPTHNGGFNRFSYTNSDYKLSRTDSFNSSELRNNTEELIGELKVKLKKQSSMKSATNGDGPYRDCNNLDDILTAHDRINKS